MVARVARAARDRVAVAAPTLTERLLLAAAAACVTSTAAYALIRCAEVAFLPEANPRAIVGAVKSPFAWRCALSLYPGGMAFFGGYALTQRSPAAASRWLRRGVIAAIAAIVVQIALAP